MEKWEPTKKLTKSDGTTAYIWDNKLHRWDGPILKICNNQTGYCQVNLVKNKKITTKSVHRIVADAFIPNIDNKPDINHINGNKKDNSTNNLEWCTQSENSLHAHRIGIKTNKCKTILQYDKEGNFIAEYKGSRSAAKSTNTHQTNIVQCCKGKVKTVGGFIFKYKEYEID